MKQANYSILDRGYFDFMKSLTEELSDRGIGYVLVGGTGVQTTIASLLTKNGESPLDAVPALDVLLRKTDDFDISCAQGSDVDGMLLEWPTIDSHVQVNPIAGRKAAKLTYIDGRRGENQVNVGLNYQTEPSDLKGLPASIYDRIIAEGTDLTIRHGVRPAVIRVARPEHIVASKLTRVKAKDQIDVANLLRTMQSVGKEFDYETVRKILVEADKEHEYRFLEDLKREILDKQ